MPFYFWLPFLLFDLYNPVTDEYYMQFGVGPGYQSTAYTLDDANERLGGVGASGVARIGVLVTPRLGFYTAAVGNGLLTHQDLKSSAYSGPVEHSLSGFGLGAHYQMGKVRAGGGLYYGLTQILMREGDHSSETLSERDGPAGEIFVEYILGENVLGDDWIDRFKYRGTVSLNALAHQDGSAGLALLLNGSIGYAPLRARQ